MKKKVILAIIVLIFLVIVGSGFRFRLTSKQTSPLRSQTLDLTPTPKPTPAIPGNVLSNPSFEGDYVSWGNAWNVAPGWVPFSAPANPPYCIAGQPGCIFTCPSNCGDCDPQVYDFGCWICVPEFKANTLQFPERVHSGEKAQQFFFWGREGEGGVYQRARVVPGARVRFTAYLWAWQCADLNGYNSRSDRPATGQMNMRVGIDPTGGVVYTSTNVVWSAPDESRDQWVQLAVEANALSYYVTAFIYSRPDWGWAHYHNNVYADDAVLTITAPLTPTYQVALPDVLKNYNAIPPAHSGPILELVPVSPVVSLGDVVTVTARITNLSRQLIDAEVQLAASDNLEVLEVNPGPFLACTKEMRVLLSPIVFDCAGGPSAGLEGQLFEIVARAVGPGQASIKPLNWTSVFVEFVSIEPDDPDNLGGGIANPVTRGASITIR